MKTKELKEVTVVYCDICGCVCDGNYKIYGSGTENEVHACLRFDETENKTCDMKMEERLGFVTRKTPNVEITGAELAKRPR